MAGASIIDGKKVAAEVRGKVAAGVARFQGEHGFAPGLAVVLVGEDPASQVYVRNKAKATREAGMASLRAQAASRHGRSGAARPDRRPQSSPRRARHPGAAAAPQAHRCNQGDRGDQPGQGRGRLPPHQRRPSGNRRRGAGALHAYRLPDPGEVGPAQARGARGRRHRPLQHRRQADGPAAARRELHGHDRPFAHARSAGRGPPRRHRGGCGGPRGDGARRLDQARRHRHRRRHSARGGSPTGRPGWSATWPLPRPPKLPAPSRRCRAGSGR